MYESVCGVDVDIDVDADVDVDVDECRRGGVMRCVRCEVS